MFFESFVAPNQTEAFYIHTRNMLFPISFHLQDLPPCRGVDHKSLLNGASPFCTWAFMKKAGTSTRTYFHAAAFKHETHVCGYLCTHLQYSLAQMPSPLPLMKLSLQNYHHYTVAFPPPCDSLQFLPFSITMTAGNYSSSVIQCPASCPMSESV